MKYYYELFLNKKYIEEKEDYHPQDMTYMKEKKK